MATLADQTHALDILSRGGGAPISLDFLSIKPIVENMIEVQFKPIFDEIKAQAENAKEAEAEIKETKSRLEKYFTTDAAKVEIENKIAEIRHSIEAVFEQFASIPKQLRTMAEKYLVPPAISAPPSVSNPLRDLLSSKETVEKIKRVVKQIVGILILIFSKASELSLILPDSILNLSTQIGYLNILLSSVPVF